MIKTKNQIERFKEVAREAVADEDEAAFKAKLAMVAKQNPKDEKTRNKK